MCRVQPENTPKAFEAFFRRYRAGLVHFAAGYVKDHSDAEEIVHDMFVAVWQKRDHLQIDETLKSYMFTGVKNRCLNHIKKARLPQTDMPEDYSFTSVDANALQQIQAAETERKIHLLIDQLPTKCRQVFLLSRIEELSYKEIAELMDITPKTVENQIGLALKFLKQGMNLGTGGKTL